MIYPAETYLAYTSSYDLACIAFENNIAVTIFKINYYSISKDIFIYP